MNQPFNFSDYNRTYNNAIDLVAQAVGYHRKRQNPLKAIILRPAYYDLFRKGVEVLMLTSKNKQVLKDEEELTMDHIPVRRGSPFQWEPLICEFHKPVMA
ncbi:hypothetical protein PV783_11560 [Chitinophaga sp. CC14]|uniref:hypothetical protein n=1 Tax=Chitinophaga sp. CC14 TaxID=3029199 RepID=UPI003B7EEF96